jgi:putative restriction endonuclease
MSSIAWTRKETLAAFNLYCRTPFGRLHFRNPDIVRLAGALGRTPSSVAMKCCNLASLDAAQQARGIAGLRGASRLDRQVWHEFEEHPESVAFESELAFAHFMDQPPRQDPVVAEELEGLEREALVRVRVNQHLFRSMVLTSYGACCAVCRLSLAELLVAAHIVPWSVDASLRMNPRNGIALCCVHERAFDRGLLAIGADYVISVHAIIRERSSQPMVQQLFLAFAGSRIHTPERWMPDPALLQRQSQLVRSARGD